MRAVIAAFNQEKALVGAFSVITNLRMELFEALVRWRLLRDGVGLHGGLALLRPVRDLLGPAAGRPLRPGPDNGRW